MEVIATDETGIDVEMRQRHGTKFFKDRKRPDKGKDNIKDKNRDRDKNKN